jgi:GTPase
MVRPACRRQVVVRTEAAWAYTTLRRWNTLRTPIFIRQYTKPSTERWGSQQNNHSFYQFAKQHKVTTRHQKLDQYGISFSSKAGDSDSSDTQYLAELLERTDCLAIAKPKPPPNPQGRRRRLDVAIVGLPNAGKSQLLNILTGSTVSAVSRKRHTTRQGIMAARTVTKEDDKGKPTTTQLLFVDTPGFLNVGPSSSDVLSRKRDVSNVEKLDRDLMVAEARREMVAVDYTVLVIDAARRFTPDVREVIVELIMMALASHGRIEDVDDDDDDDDDNYDDDDKSDGDNKIIQDEGDDDEVDVLYPLQKFAVVLNKVDLVHPKSKLLELAFEIGALAQKCLEYRPSQQTNGRVNGASEPLDESLLVEVMPTFFYTSALNNEGVDDLLNFLLQKATPASVFEVEPGAVTNLQPEEQMEEIIREKLYRCLHKELPYQIQQRNRVFKVTKDPDSGKFCLYIEQDLLVVSRTHQELVRGRGNHTLERIRETAEFTMKQMLKCDVILKLEVRFSKSKSKSEFRDFK